MIDIYIIFLFILGVYNIFKGNIITGAAIISFPFFLR